MKKMMMAVSAALMLTCCEKDFVSESSVKNEKEVTFRLGNDFSVEPFTRSLEADGSEMTDLWLFDYVDDVLIQSVHQTPDEDEWGTISMSLSYGSHHLYIVASRGDLPSVDEPNHIITWETPRDCFWSSYGLDVSSQTGDQNITLSRVATRLKVSVTDEIPSGTAAIVITPSLWYYGIDYMSGNAVNGKTKERKINVPSSLIGTTGQLSLSVFGLSSDTEWQSDVIVSIRDSDDMTIGAVTLSEVPFARNRTTVYSGALFGRHPDVNINLSDEWGNDFSGSW